MQPLVSVIIPTYKRPNLLSRSVESVISQTYGHYELIIVDDNHPGTDERRLTEKAMQRYKDNECVYYIQHSQNKNGSAARNTGFSASKGDFIMFLDDDDEFLPKKMEAQVNCLQNRDKTWGACYTDYVRVNQQGKVIMKNAEHREGNLYVEELKRNLFVHAGSNLMIRREVVEELGGFDEFFLRNQDVEFLVRLLKKYKLAYVHELGLVVHMHKNRQGIDLSKVTESFIDKFSNEISQLDYKEKKEVLAFINLQLFRFKLLKHGERWKGIQMILNHEVNAMLALRYCMHLVRRKITKKAYGFHKPNIFRVENK